MKVQGNYNQYSAARAKQQAFGNYVNARRINRAVGSMMSGRIKTLYTLGKNNGENLNNTVTAVGTAAVAPIFIRYNPLSDEDPKVKAYSALRQPLSAVLALGVQLPVMTAYNKLLDMWATSGRVRRFDLSAKPPETTLKNLAKAKYNQEMRVLKAQGLSRKEMDEKFFKGRTKAEVIEDFVNQSRDDIFYAKRDHLRELAANGQPITVAPLKNADGKIVDYFHPTKLSELDKIQFVKPDEIDKARKSVYPNVLREFGVDPDNKKLFEIKYDWEDPNAIEKHNKMKNGEIPVPEDLKEYKKSKVKSALKKQGHKYNEFSRKLEDTAKNAAIEKVEQSIAEEVKVKLETSKAFNELNRKLANVTSQIYNDSSIPKELKDSVIEKEDAKLIDAKIKELKKRAENADEVVRNTLNNAITKLKDKKVNEIKFHGDNYKDVEISVRAKRWLKAEINRREGVFKNFKKLSGLIFGLAILPFTCGLLNWAYPKFMKKFFPELCDAKQQAKAAKEAK